MPSKAPLIKDTYRGLRAVRLPATVDEAQLPFTGMKRLLLAVEIFFAYGRARRLLAATDLPQTVAALRGPSDTSRDWRGDPYLAQVIGVRLGSAVRHALSVLPTDSRCLVRSLVLTHLLARRGIASTLVIGVNPSAEFSAHAWVERDHAPLLPTGHYASNRLVEL